MTGRKAVGLWNKSEICRGRNQRLGFLFLCSLSCALFLCANAGQAASAKPEKPKPARLRISGYGLLGNRELRRILRTVELGGKKPEFFTAEFVEDASLILASRVRQDGYLRPSISAQITLASGGIIEVQTETLLESPLPHPLAIRAVHFRIHPGTLYYFKSLQFEGLEGITERQAIKYFVETDELLHLRHSRIYTPDRLRRGVSSLSDVLDQLGYTEAQIDEPRLQMNDTNGQVFVTIRVHAGSKFIVHSVRQEYQYQNRPNPSETRTVFPNHPFSRLWQQDFSLSLRTNQYQRGYPDTTVELKKLATRVTPAQTEVDLLATVKSGALVRIGKVEFVGQKRTNPGLLARRVRVYSGELLNLSKTEEGRYRLAQLGVFDTVDLSYRNQDESTRDVIYRVHEGKQLNVSLLVGWGSYELLRGGAEAQINNLWGLAHHLEVKGIQSFKATSGNLTYTVPEFVGRDIDLFVNGSGLRREEPDFLRLEYGGGVGLHKYLQEYATDVTARYNYQILSALDTSIAQVASEGLTNPAVGSIIVDIKHDRRDNPLYPQSGYKFFTTIETATQYLGGDANYERVEASFSWHLPLGGGLHFSLGLSQGIDYSFGSAENNLPFNKRFFPGGSDSIRGYQEDEASPRNAQGQLVGAETYSLGTVELEQALTPRWSIVAFSDSLGFAHRIADYPFDTGLFSVGGGIRWRTIIGPIRLEYGYNLNPRPQDPSGTLQFSLGFPF